MKLFAYALRPYDELLYLEKAAKDLGFEFAWTEEHLTADNIHLAKDADVVSVLLCKIDRDVLKTFAAWNIKGVATRSIGFDHIDLAAAKEYGIRIANAPYPPNGVANFTIMLMLEALRKTKYISRHAQAQNFDLHGKLGKDITSCTIGIVGTGRIGFTVIKHLSGFGAKIVCYDPYPKDEAKQYADYVDFDTLLQVSDVVSLHVPAYADNYHLIDAAAMNKMKTGAVLINAARGDLVDTKALISALEDGKIAAAGLDVVEGESKILYNDLRYSAWYDRDRAVLEAMPNVIIYPHVAFYTEEDVQGMVDNSTRALIAFYEGKETAFEVTL